VSGNLRMILPTNGLFNNEYQSPIELREERKCPQN